MTPEQTALRRLVIDWLDDNLHFGDAEKLIGDDDDRSFMKSGILDSLGFVKLILHIEDRCKVRLDPKKITPANFDSLQRIIHLVSSLPGFKVPQ